MKKLFFAFILLLFSICSHKANSQYLFSIKDMQNMSKLTAEEFDAFAVSKKYTLQTEASTKDVKVYAPEKKRASGNYEVSWTKSKKESAVISCTNPNGGWYHKIQTAIKTGNEGWEFIKEKKKKINGVASFLYHYENKEYHLVLCALETSQSGTPLTYYRVECYAIN